MAAGRKRREPMFDVLPTPADLRVSGRDRAGGDGDASRRGRARRERDEAPPRKKGSRGGKGGGRSPLGRLIYWGFVLTLWLLILAIGALVWVGAHLPSIQALEIPKRPPTVQITGLDGRVFATRGEMSGADIPLKEMPAHLPRALIAIEDRRFFSHHGVDPIGVAPVSEGAGYWVRSVDMAPMLVPSPSAGVTQTEAPSVVREHR